MVAVATAILRQTIDDSPLIWTASKWWVYASYEGSEAVVPRNARDLQKLANEAAATGSNFLNASSDAHLGGLRARPCLAPLGFPAATILNPHCLATQQARRSR